MNESLTILPCINIYKTDPLSGFCYDYGLTNEEKINCENSDTLCSPKEENLSILKERLSDGQKNAFDKSYISKQKTSLSFLKKNLIESKKLI